MGTDTTAPPLPRYYVHAALVVTGVALWALGQVDHVAGRLVLAVVLAGALGRAGAAVLSDEIHRCDDAGHPAPDEVIAAAALLGVAAIGTAVTAAAMHAAPGHPLNLAALGSASAFFATLLVMALYRGVIRGR